jgi:hypothetical protein
LKTVDVDEREAFKYSAVLMGDDGLPPPLSGLKLTLYDTATGTIVNNRDDQDVLNMNGVTYNQDTGEIVWGADAADSAIVTPTVSKETHVALFVAHWGGTKEKPWEITMKVRNLTQHPATPP